MQLVLQCMLDLALEVRRDVVAVRDVADACQRHTCCEALAEGRQLGLHTTATMVIDTSGCPSIAFHTTSVRQGGSGGGKVAGMGTSFGSQSHHRRLDST